MKNYIIYNIYFLKYYFEILISKLFSKTEQERYLADSSMFVLLAHHKVRQRYDSCYPYYYHLKMVTGFITKFKYLLSDEEYVKAFIAGNGHDTIEDVHFFTYNNIVEKWGVETADIIFACTELRGKNRAARHGAEYYSLLQQSELGSFVKICDVIANMTMGTMTGSSMLKKYRKDYPKFKQLLYKDKFKPLFDYLEQNLLTDK